MHNTTYKVYLDRIERLWS